MVPKFAKQCRDGQINKIAELHPSQVFIPPSFPPSHLINGALGPQHARLQFNSPLADEIPPPELVFLFRPFLFFSDSADSLAPSLLSLSVLNGGWNVTVSHAWPPGEAGASPGLCRMAPPSVVMQACFPSNLQVQSQARFASCATLGTCQVTWCRNPPNRRTSPDYPPSRGSRGLLANIPLRARPFNYFCDECMPSRYYTTQGMPSTSWDDKRLHRQASPKFSPHTGLYAFAWCETSCFRFPAVSEVKPVISEGVPDYTLSDTALSSRRIISA